MRPETPALSNSIAEQPGRQRARLRLALGVLLCLLAGPAWSQWAAEAGDRVRNGFGPESAAGASACRGACGAGCPSSCDQEVRYECRADGSLTRVRRYSCGTHPACRDHDDCLDRCVSEQAEGYDCAAYCHSEAVDAWGMEPALTWAAGGGPYQGDAIIFDYSMDRPGGAEAVYVCPEGAERQCADGQGLCQRKGRPVDPVFGGYQGGAAKRMQIEGFRSGRVCTAGSRPEEVCRVSMDIPITGQDRCRQAEGDVPCSWYGFEMNYRNAVPGEPMYCRTSADGEDFLGRMISKGMAAGGSPGGHDDDSADPAIPKEFSQIFEQVQRDVEKGRSLEGALSDITIVTEDGQVVGGPAGPSPYPRPGVPNEVMLDGSSGHVMVAMFERTDGGAPGSVIEHQVTCLQGGEPVVETTFRLHFADTGPAAGGRPSDPGDGNCSCACSNKDTADELCAFFCEEEFAACGR